MLVFASRIALSCVIAATALACAGQAQPASPGGKSNTLPADFQVIDDSGEKVALRQLIGERIAVIDFWATWCKPCRKSLPEVNALAENVQSENVAVIALNIGEKPDQVGEFRQELGLTLPVAFDREMELPEKLGITTLPALIVVAADGRVVHIGKTLDDAARAKLDSLLQTPSKQPDSQPDRQPGKQSDS